MNWDNFRFPGRYYGDRAIYTCDSGHQIVGNEERVCQETGLWSNGEPYCKKKGNMEQWINTTEKIWTVTADKSTGCPETFLGDEQFLRP